MGIVLKLERIPLNIGLGVCLGMVPLVGYNYGRGNTGRMNEFVSLARIVILCFSLLCALAFFFFPNAFVGMFIKDAETVRAGAEILRGRCFALPFMMIGYHVVNYMNAVNRGKISFLLAIVRHLALIVPLMLLMNLIWKMPGLIWSQLAANAMNAVVTWTAFRRVNQSIREAAPGR